MTEEAHTAEAPEMMGMPPMPPMLAYTVRSPVRDGFWPHIRIGQGNSGTAIKPDKPVNDSYWIVILDANAPATRVRDWIVPGLSNTTVPGDLDQYMSNPRYLFAVTTQVLSNASVPQGPFYDYLAAHGAGRELQKLEQVSSHTQSGYGLYQHVSYVLTGHCGPPGRPAYEASAFEDWTTILMSLMPQPNGQPPYSICDSYTFIK